MSSLILERLRSLLRRMGNPWQTRHMTSRDKRRLPVLQLDDVLSGKIAPRLETQLAALESGSPLALRALAAAADIAVTTVSSCIAPSVRVSLLEILDSVGAPARRGNVPSVNAPLRSRLATSESEARRATVDAVRQAQALQAKNANATLLDPHADAVVLRHVALSATHACTAVQLVLDSVRTPRTLESLPLQAAGAMAYRNCALGLARDARFRRLVCEHATLEREQAPIADLSAGAVAIQLFHEYVGARWKDHCEAQRLDFEGVLDRALQAPAPLASELANEE